ncbi:MAG: aldehyde dehydrogenase [Acidimicrobiia bacterium]|jgi:betaine-aldehyde dehydrogenase/5-carboxymethyl-2-hydroxymuconic-semialdehyde dehydrogenase
MTSGSDDRRVDVAGVDVSMCHFVNGRRIDSPTTFETRSPNDWVTVLGDVARGDKETASLAVAAATSAAQGWADLGPAGRADVLHRLADAIDDSVEEISLVETHDMAFNLESMRARLVHRGAENFRSYANMALDHVEREWDSKGTHNRVIRMPAGPAVIITPWNAPWMLATWKVAPALAAGNPVVLKPAEWSPLSASVLGDLAAEVGVPPGVLNIVQGFGKEVGAALVSDPRVRRIAFTGSPETGRAIGLSAAANLVPLTAEMGGKGPLLVFADADIESAAKTAAGQYDDSGQVCLAGTRLLVEESVANEFLTRFHSHVDKLVLGTSTDRNTDIGPMVHPDHVARVLGFIDRARSHGDEIVRGGHRSARGDMWIEPTLIRPRDNQSEVVQSEVFGPVLTFQTFATEEEAIELANSTDYGLSAVVYTTSQGRAVRVGEAIRAGTVWVNTFLVRDLSAPFGGCGISGIGREGGRHALEFHADLKTLQILDSSVS